MFIRLYPEFKEFTELSKEGNIIPVCMEYLADTETPVSALSRFRNDSSNVFLFESLEGGERWARYSFLGTSSYREINVFKDNVTVTQKGKKKIIPHYNDPFKVIRELNSEYKPVSMPDLPVFWGGLVGYITYEAVSFFEKIKNDLPEDMPLASFMTTDNLIIFDNVKHVITFVSHVFLEKNDDPEKRYNNALKELKKMLKRFKEPVSLMESDIEDKDYILKPVLSEEIFIDNIKKVKDHIFEGDIIQAVISQPFISEKAPDSLLFYRLQRFINPSPYLYYVKMNDSVLAGSSPETMVNLQNGVATLRPIAGTRPRGKTQQEDRMLADELLKDPKERAEHLMLVDLGRNDLGKVAETGSVQVTELMFIEKYSHVMHLVSNINCDLKKGLDAWDLLRSVFPAGTLSGAPKIRAMEIIHEVEKNPRGPYGGAIGYISFNGNMDMAITIRTAVIQNNVLKVQAGAGIVADSDPETERRETLNKAIALQKALQMINNYKSEFMKN